MLPLRKVGQMNHIDDKLNGDEKIVYRTGLHWVILCGPAILLFLSGISISSKGMSAMILFAIALAWGVLSYVVLRNEEFAITNDRLLVWTVFPWKKLKSVTFAEITNMGVSQPTLGKLLNFGKITIVLSNRKRISHRMVNSPYELLMRLQHLVEAVRDTQRESPPKSV